MNILRGVVASLLVSIFILLASAVALGFGLERAIVPETAATIIDEAKAGERLTSVLPDIITQGLPKSVSSQFRSEDMQRFVSDALPANEADSMLRSLAGEVVSYIRGESNTLSKIDLAPTEARAEAAAKKIMPGITGRLLASMVKQQFDEAGLNNGLQIPREQMDVARNAVSQFRFGENIALVLMFLVILLVFAVSPHGLAGRLRRCGIAFITAGCLSAVSALSFLFIRQIMSHIPFNGSVPPQIQDFIKDAVAVLGKILAQNIFIVAAIYIGCGATLLVINLILRKRGVPPAPVAALQN